MSSKFPQGLALVIAGALLLLSSLASQDANAQKKNQPQTAPATCSDADKKQIIQKIRERIQNDPKLKDQLPHINVDIYANPKSRVNKEEVVLLEGYVTAPATRLAVESHAKAVLRGVTCVKKILNEVGGAPIGCDEGYKSCGNSKSCIRESSSCN
jgi:hypothetical protein